MGWKHYTNSTKFIPIYCASWSLTYTSFCYYLWKISNRGQESKCLSFLWSVWCIKLLIFSLIILFLKKSSSALGGQVFFEMFHDFMDFHYLSNSSFFFYWTLMKMVSLFLIFIFFSLHCVPSIVLLKQLVDLAQIYWKWSKPVH